MSLQPVQIGGRWDVCLSTLSPVRGHASQPPPRTTTGKKDWHQPDVWILSFGDAAVRPEDILEILRTQPFEPFRVYLTDGATYEIRHPDVAIVQRSKVTIAVPGPDGPDGPAERTVNCELIHITRTEILDGTDQHG